MCRILSERTTYEAKIAALEKRLICSFCGGTDLVCGRGHIESTAELKKQIASLTHALELAEGALKQTHYQMKKLVEFLDKQEISVGSFAWVILRDFDYKRAFEANEDALAKIKATHADREG